MTTFEIGLESLALSVRVSLEDLWCALEIELLQNYSLLIGQA